MDDESVKDVQLVGLTVIELSILMTIIFLCVVYYLKATTNLDFKTWDIDTTTASDFTVQMPISDDMWNWYQREKKNNPNFTLPLDQHIKQTLEEKI